MTTAVEARPRVLASSERQFVVLVGDAISVTAGTLLALWTWSITAGAQFSPAFVREHAVWLLTIPLWLVALSRTRQPHMIFSVRDTIRGIAQAAVILFVSYSVAFFYSEFQTLPRLVAMYVLWDCALLVFASRVIVAWTLTRAAFARRVVVVGDRDGIDAALALFGHAGFSDIDVIGVVATSPADESVRADRTLLGTPQELAAVARATGATDIVLSSSGEVDPAIAGQLLHCRELGADVTTIADLYEEVLRRVPVRQLGPAWMLSSLVVRVPARGASPLAKRLLDVTVGAVLAIIGLAVTPVIAALVLLESGTPVFYTQTRLGRGGRVFPLTKFRTMRRDAEVNGPEWSQVDDPRVTRVGRLLRRTRLDELPNVTAVLRGDLSMVGPRPERPEFVAMLEQRVPLYRARLLATPGLTGWAQINHEYGDSVEDAEAKLEYDLYYIKHQSFWFDLTILAQTVWTIIGLRGR